MGDTLHEVGKSHLLLSGAIAANLACLPPRVVEHYLARKDQIRQALLRGFALPGQKTSVVEVSSSTTNPERDLNWWISKTEEFAKKYLRTPVDLRRSFAIPSKLTWTWKGVIPVFDPGNLTNRGVVEKALKSLGLGVSEDIDVMRYAGSEADNEPTLHFIEESVKPNSDTMNLSPNEMRMTGKPCLRLRGYALASGVYHFATGKYLDPKTYTWFPEDRLTTGIVMYGHWLLGRHKVRFFWNNPDYHDPTGGSRVAVPIPLNS